FFVNGSEIASGASSTATWDSTSVGDGPVNIEVSTTDEANNTTPSSPVSITVDNHAPAPSVNDPGAAISGVTSISPSSDPDTATVEFQERVQGAGSWTTLGTVGAPFQVTFDTTGLNGTYELQAIATDGAGHTGTSATRTVLVDNVAPTGSVTK